jgi:hypothetical protein
MSRQMNKYSQNPSISGSNGSICHSNDLAGSLLHVAENQTRFTACFSPDFDRQVSKSALIVRLDAAD